jgi:hypothetical protein
MKRRAFLVTAGIAGTGVAVAGCGPTAGDRKLVLSSFAQALPELERLAKLPALRQAAAWGWAQTLNHCAQSIEFSMTGFPAPKSALFQNTVGGAAFHLFAARGRMSHDLSEPIPGAPVLSADADAAAAMARLRRAVADFQAWTKPLQPHFAYGQLDKAQFEQAHAMHLANHFSAFDTGA